MLLCAAFAPAALHAQAGVPRTLDYLTASVGHDVRTNWSNPALLTVVPEASIIAEVRVDNPSLGDLRLGQWTAGFNSRGLSIIYQRDRFTNDTSGTALRIGLASPFGGGALGASYTVFGGTGENVTDLDLGLALTLGPTMTLGLVARHLRTPLVRNRELPLTLVASGSVRQMVTGIIFSIEANYKKSTAVDPSEFGYGGLASWSYPGWPVSIVVAGRTDGSFSEGTLMLGLSLGTSESIFAMPTMSIEQGGGTRLQSVSLTGIASRRLSLP